MVVVILYIICEEFEDFIENIIGFFNLGYVIVMDEIW